MFKLRCKLQSLTQSLLGSSTPKQAKKNRVAEVLGWADAPVPSKKVNNFLWKAFPCARYVQVGNSSANVLPLYGNTSFVYVLDDLTAEGFTKVLRWMGMSGCKFAGEALTGTCRPAKNRKNKKKNAGI